MKHRLNKIRKSTSAKASLVPYAVIVLLSAALFWIFQTEMPYHFYFKEQNQLFLNSAEYVLRYFNEEGGLSLLMGDFLTQFYYYAYAGSLILALSLLLLGVFCYKALLLVLPVFKKACSKGVWAKALALAIALLFMVYEAMCSMAWDYPLSKVLSPVIALCLLVALFSVAKWLLHKPLFASNLRLKWGLLAVAGLLWIFGVSVFCCPFVGKPQLVDRQLEAYFSADTEYYFGHTQRVIQIVENAEARNEAMEVLRTMAYARQGRLTDTMDPLSPPNLGTFITITDQSPVLTIHLMKDFYWLLGDMTYTERAAMLSLVFSPNSRNVRCIKRLAEVNLVTGDTLAAMKFLRLLEQTIPYRQWALDHTPGRMTLTVKSELEQKAKFQPEEDDIRLGDNCRDILLGLLQRNRQNTVALDYLLCSDMLSGKKELFVADYQQFGPRPLPIYLSALKNQ